MEKTKKITTTMEADISKTHPKKHPKFDPTNDRFFIKRAPLNEPQTDQQINQTHPLQNQPKSLGPRTKGLGQIFALVLVLF